MRVMAWDLGRPARGSLVLGMAGALLLCVSASLAADKVPFGREGTLKVRVHGPGLVRVVSAAGGRLVADYGTFSLMEVSEGQADVLALPGVEAVPDGNAILLRTGPLDTSRPGGAVQQQAAAPAKGKGLRLVQFAGPVKPEWFNAITATGAEVIAHVPNNAYLVYADAAAAAGLSALAASADYVQWEGAYGQEHRVHPAARAAGQRARQMMGPAAAEPFSIQLVADAAANAETLQLIERLASGPPRSSTKILHYQNLVAALPPDRLDELAARPDVLFILPFVEPERSDERQNMIVAGFVVDNAPGAPGYLEWLTAMGFTQAQFNASRFVVDITDSGIDNGTTSPNHFGLYEAGIRPGTSRVAYNRLLGTPNFPSTVLGCDGHGTVNAHIVGGYNTLSGFPHEDPEGYQYGLGIVPFARIGASVIFDPRSFTYPDYSDLISRAYRDGARISSNSWGAQVAGEYDTQTQMYDILVRDAQPAGATVSTPGNQEMVIVFSAGNSGPSPGTIGSPGGGKNVISVGAAENVRALGGPDACGLGDDSANRANDMAGFSSRGPTADGRIKPDMVAPGTHVTGGVVQVGSPGPLGTADPCFVANGICGGPGIPFFPPGQQFYTASSGTSHSCPAVSGGAALLRQHFINQGWAPPSPAMTKAVLLNSARYLDGIGAGGTLPARSQGMGALDLGEALKRGSAAPTFLRDQLAGDLFTASGQSRVFTGSVADKNTPFRVTLTWTDAPGSLIGAAYMNDLDLTVTVGGNTYRGNVFAGPDSIPGGASDKRNNVESVFIPAGVEGNWSVRVTAASINSDGVPNVGGPLDQDFALVVYNATEAPEAVLESTGVAVAADTCRPLNGVLDPNESVTVGISLRNVGVAAAGDVTATLVNSDSVLAVSGPQNFGPLPAGGEPVTRQFSFTASGSCGQPLTLTLRLQDGDRDLGVASVSVPVGAPITVLAENFDGLVPPALPAGWSATLAAGNPPGWASTGASFDTSPHSVFAPAVAIRLDSQLESPTFSVSTAAARLAFRHRYSFRSGDGGALEISMNGGAYRDITAMGGNFIFGGYNGLVSFTSSVLAQREVWTGNSVGFVTSIVELPAIAQGQEVRLRWRLATDAFLASEGWYIDSVHLTDGYACCYLPAVAALEGPSTSATRGGPITYTVQFSEPVTGFDSAEDVLLLATGTAAAGSVTVSGTDAGPYTITLAQLTGTGTLAIALPAGAGQDADGNPSFASAAAPSAIVDNTPVSCTVARLDDSPTTATSFRFSIHFSKPVADFVLADVGLSSTVLRLNAGDLTGEGTDYVLELVNVSGNGDVCLTIPAGAVHDALGNPNTASTQACYAVQQLPPKTDFNFQLVAVPASNTNAGLGSLPPTLLRVRSGELFFLELWARDETKANTGLTCVYADMLYDPELVRILNIIPEQRFDTEPFAGGQDNGVGRVDELGGCYLPKPNDPKAGQKPEWARVVRVLVRATLLPCSGPGCQPASAHFSLAQAAGESSAYGQGKVPSGNIFYGKLEVRISPLARPDLDQDGDVDLDDLAFFETCATGPAIPIEQSWCRAADFDNDLDIDQSDFGVLQGCFTGRGISADPACDR